MVTVHPVTTISEDEVRKVAYPIVPAHACTICKAQGKNLNGMILWLDTDMVPAGTAYVALSRIRKLMDLCFMVKTKCEKYNPVKAINI